ncbi:MAG: DUF4340 domain-containing protein [Terriglobales bacterium]
MKLRGLIVATVVLAGLTGALYWSNHHKPAETTEASADVPPKILTLKEDDITKIDLKKKGTDEMVLARNSSGKWQMTVPQTLGVEQPVVSGMLATLSSLSSDRLVEDKAGNLSQYGLAEPTLEADLTAKDNKTYKLLIGDKTPTGNALYAKLGGDPRVFTMAGYARNSIDKSVNDVRDKRLLTIEQDKISQVELTAKKQDVVFGRNKDEWQIIKPKPQRADGSKVDELIRTLVDAKMDLTGSEQDSKKIAAAFASATPVATAKVTGEAGTQELQVRKNKDDYYAQSTAVPGIYKVASSVGTGLDKDPEDFRNKKLFDFGFDDPDKIEVHDGAKAYFLTRSGEDWWNGSSKKMDASGVQSLIDKLRDLSATKFVDSGFSTPALELTVISNDGKRMDKVLISKSGESYVAKRENEPALYQLDAKAVSDLQKSASDMKPVAAPAGK